MQTIWCYKCCDYKAHQENVCSCCGRVRESALTRKMSTMNAKIPSRNYRWVVSGIYENNVSYYLDVRNHWILDKQQAHQFTDKRQALEALETVERPFDDFYPNVLQIEEGEAF